MQNTKSPLPRERNPETYQKHQKEVLWQITIPLIAGLVILLILMVGCVSSAINQSRMADISLIWIILPNLVMALITLIILVGLIYGLIKLIGILPYYTQKIQVFFNLIKDRAQNIDDRLIEPIIKGKTTSASLRKLKDQLFRR